jgi:uncharacterized protein
VDAAPARDPVGMAMVERPNVEDLDPAEARVLGALLEKQVTTPDIYPLTLKALTSACNQSSNRDPVLDLATSEVEAAVLSLKSRRLARVVHPAAGERATKYRQVADEELELDPGMRAVLCVLLLRGAQTASELRSRTERLHAFAGVGEVEAALEALADHDPPLVAHLERRPGQKEGRWIQLLEEGAEERAATPVAVGGGGGSVGGGARGGAAGRVDELEGRVAALEARVAELVEALGDLVDLPPAGDAEAEPSGDGWA